jgi:hypothetical protein
MRAATTRKEEVMNKDWMFECGTCYFQGSAREFTPITVSANFAALECPNCLNNDEDSFTSNSSSDQQAA